MASTEKDVDGVVRTAVRSWRVPGVAVGIVRDDRVIYLEGKGVRRKGGEEEISPRTLFPLGSCSKGFITASLAQLADAGKLRWDDPVRKHLPTFWLADPLADSQVTLRDLLCHRTGVGTHDLLWYRPAWTPEEAVRRVGRIPLDRSFRSTFQYQSTMYSALGLVIEKVSGMPWPQYVQKHLFDPLGLKTAGCSTATFTSEDRAAGHRLNDRGEAEPMDDWVPFPRPDAAASIHAGAGDLCTWLRFQLNEGVHDGKRLVSAANLQETHTPQMVIPQGDHERALHLQTNLVSYGMGWVIQDYRGLKLVAHTGVLDGFRIQLSMVPSKRLGIVVLANLHGTRMNLALTYSLIDLLLDLGTHDWNESMLKEVHKLDAIRRKKEMARQTGRHQGTDPSRVLSAYAATYEHPGYGEAKVTVRRDRLHLSYSTFEMPLKHFHYDTFLARHPHLGEILFTFALNPGGVVSEMTAVDWYGVVFKRK